MIIVLKPQHTQNQLESVLQILSERNAETEILQTSERTTLVVKSTQLSGPKVDFTAFDFVEQVISFKSQYPKVGKSAQSEKTKIIKVGNLVIGDNSCVVISGPCAVEDREQMLRIAREAKRAGAHILRGGAYKPRTSPYSFQGLGEEGLELLRQARAETGLPIVTEALDVRDISRVAEVSDIVQIGSRNMQNFPLLKEAGKLKKPVMLKRGMSSTLQEWLLAAEYIAEKGNDEIILCERGVRSFDPLTRNLLDLSAVPVLKGLTHLPIAVDPSHGTGRRDAVESMSLAAVAAQAHAVMIEMHDQPEVALSDGFQALRPQELEFTIKKMRLVAQALGIHWQENENLLPELVTTKSTKHQDKRTEAQPQFES